MHRTLRSTVQSAIFLLTLAAGSTAHAQTWQWGKRGGGPLDGNNPQPHEQVVDMATDKHGNLYILSIVEASGSPTIDGHTLPVYGGKDILVSSFSCSGAYRWSKVIGGEDDDRPDAIATDTAGHVYVSCSVTPTGTQPGLEVHFGADSTQPIANKKMLSLIQYDTSGNFKWLRQPNADTAGFISNLYTQVFDINASGNGDIYWLVQLSEGLVPGSNGWAAQSQSYILKYDAQGQLTDHIDIPMQAREVYFQSNHMIRTPSGKFIIGGTYDNYSSTSAFTLGSQTVTHNMFLAQFNTSGQLLWEKENTKSNYESRMWSRPQIDQQGNIYYSGDCQTGDIFNGFTFYNNLSSIPYTVPFAGKADSNGNQVWTKVAGGNSGDIILNSLVLMPNNELSLTGSGGSVWWDSIHHIQGLTNIGNFLYTTRFDLSGNVLAMDSLKAVATGDVSSFTSAADLNSNLYIGGEFNTSFSIAGQVQTSTGGYSDLFIAKYGYPCNCTPPISGYTSLTTAVRTVQFTYNGTTPLDSLRWNFGDGQTQKITNAFTSPVSHTYNTDGNYTATAIAYNSCGSNVYYKDYSLAVAAISMPGDVRVYPNPAGEFITIEGAESANAVIINSIGQLADNFTIGSNKLQADIHQLAPGIYLLTIKDKNGAHNSTRIIKQ